jgi:hypothetical protein
VLLTLNGPVRVFRNDSPPAGSPLPGLLAVELQCPGANRHCYGSRIELTSTGTPSTTQRRWITGGGAFQSVDSPVAYFGLGAGSPSALTVFWPDGTKSSIARPKPGTKTIVRRDPADAPPAGTAHSANAAHAGTAPVVRTEPLRPRRKP